MPKKIRELIRSLKMAGFVDRGGRGSHRNFIHSSGIVVTLSGHPGDDAKPYQIKVIEEKIEETQR